MPFLPRRKQELGAQAEAAAQQWLIHHGLSLVTSNYRCRQGEIDLVMLDQDCLVFTEVRWRKYASHGGALASVDYHKQQRLIQAARHFLAKHPTHQQRPCRFDVIGMEPDNNGSVSYQWIQNAFYSE
ncbi:YraN family protein [Alcanivorax sp. S6407]|uniref:YraN family protein n=1 Tax=Alcanivorax sp. S6407 TaxID=2926424 RepID=UPI001FF140A3|nr:YraN family protein [Alcanivorax sp. S6407]MCK0155020.1 YraN family protein [Alcanivorax sp. S6407]